MVLYGSTGFVPRLNLPAPSRSTLMTPIVPPPCFSRWCGTGQLPVFVGNKCIVSIRCDGHIKSTGAQLGQPVQIMIGYCGTWITSSPSTPHGSVKLARRKNSAPCFSIAAPTLTCGEPGKNCIPSICCTGFKRCDDGKLITCWPPHGLTLKSDVLKT